MAAIEFAGHLLFRGRQVIFPLWLPLNSDQNILAHELQDFAAQSVFARLDGGIIDSQLSGHGCAG